MEDEHFLQPTFSPAWPNAFFITNPTVLNSPPTIFIGNHPAWLLDYVVQNGTVIPQRIWSPGTPSDAQRYNNVTLKMPIFFIHSDLRTLGLRLLHAAAGDCPGLLNARSRAPVGDCHTTSIRIKVCVRQVLQLWVLRTQRPLQVAWLRRMADADYD